MDNLAETIAWPLKFTAESTENSISWASTTMNWGFIFLNGLVSLGSLTVMIQQQVPLLLAIALWSLIYVLGLWILKSLSLLTITNQVTIDKNGVTLTKNKKVRLSLQPSEIDQFYSTTISTNSNSITKSSTRLNYTYDFRVRSHNKGATRILAGLKSAQDAHRLEEAAENLLNIQDKRVREEFQYAWRNFGEQHNLTFTVTDHLPHFQLTGQYQNYNIDLVFKLADRVYQSYFGAVLEAKTSPSALPDSEALGKAIKGWFVSHKSFHELQGQLNFRQQGTICTYSTSKIAGHGFEPSFLLHALTTMIDLYHNLATFGGEGAWLLRSILDLESASMTRFFDQLRGKEIQKSGKLELLPYQYDIAIHLLRVAAKATHYVSVDKSPSVCERCLAYCVSHTVQPRNDYILFGLAASAKIAYNGCRICHQSRDIFTPESVVMLLDRDSERETPPPLAQKKNATIYINWFDHDQLFDFSSIEIRQADDQSIERFVMQIGNDTDPYRKKFYPNMTCTVAANCHLSVNSERLLNRHFGQVTYADR